VEKEFNLLQEPWIRVMRPDCSIEEVSLPDALLHAHEYSGLGGELPTQNAAILRLLLATLHAVFERVNGAGKACPIEEADDAYERWEELWKAGCFPEAPLKEYFRNQQENFWLFHPTKPFWQISNIPAGVGTQSEPVQKLNGAISESNNTVRLFSERDANEKTKMTNAEMARWLVCMNQYDDNTLKTGLGVAFLGSFVAITAVGNTLFETLMLNFVLLDRDREPWEKIEDASWEQNVKYSENIRKIAYPNDPVKAMSYHSRFGKLEWVDGTLKYISPKGGICYEQISKNEQMCIWKRDSKTEESLTIRSLGGREVWREFNSIIADDNLHSLLVDWHKNLLKNNRLKNNTLLHYSFVEIVYDKKHHSTVENILSDSLSLHSNLLTELGKPYRLRISDIIARCDNVANNVGKLAWDLFLAAGGDIEKKDRPCEKMAREQFYYAVDVPFRKWLASLDANDTADVREQRISDWCQECDKIAQIQAEKMVQDAGRSAYIGKMVSRPKEKKIYYSSSLAMQWFQGRMKKL